MCKHIEHCTTYLQTVTLHGYLDVHIKQPQQLHVDSDVYSMILVT